MLGVSMPWWEVSLAGAFAGLGLGLGLVLGAFVARSLRRYMRDERMKPYDDDNT